MNRIDFFLDQLSKKREPFALFAIAKEYEKQKELEKSLDYYEQIHADFPDYIGLYYHLGKLYEELDNVDKAIEIYNEGIALAQRIGDRHSLGELNTALMLAED